MRILLLGDVMLGRLVNQVLRSESPAYVWGDTLPLFAAADLRICNLECVFSDRGQPWSATPKVFHFRSDRKNVAALRTAKIDMVSIANNHTLDYEYDALFEMLETLENAPIKYAGAGRNSGEAWKTCGACFGICYVPVNLQDLRATRLLSVVAETKSRTDCLIVSAHWGPNWNNQPPGPHIASGHTLVDAGADVVFGHSAHVFRGIEIYRGRPILYSTGDFIDDYAVDEIERNDDSFAFVLDLHDCAVREMTLYPTLISDFRARRAEPAEAHRICTTMAWLCDQFGTPSAWSPAEKCLIVPVAEAVERAAKRA